MNFQLNDDGDVIILICSSKGMKGEGGEEMKKHCLIMDEVDGMSGNEDRGGVQVSFVAWHLKHESIKV